MDPGDGTDKSKGWQLISFGCDGAGAPVEPAALLLSLPMTSKCIATLGFYNIHRTIRSSGIGVIRTETIQFPSTRRARNY
jgi:hypothetical protein